MSYFNGDLVEHFVFRKLFNKGLDQKLNNEEEI